MGATGALLVGSVVAGAAASYLSPGPPKPKPPPLMPSQAQVTQGQQLEAAKAAALRQGRSSTILTSSADTGDKLGP